MDTTRVPQPWLALQDLNQTNAPAVGTGLKMLRGYIKFFIQARKTKLFKQKFIIYINAFIKMQNFIKNITKIGLKNDKPYTH